MLANTHTPRMKRRKIFNNINNITPTSAIFVFLKENINSFCVAQFLPLSIVVNLWHDCMQFLWINPISFNQKLLGAQLHCALLPMSLCEFLIGMLTQIELDFWNLDKNQTKTMAFNIALKWFVMCRKTFTFFCILVTNLWFCVEHYFSAQFLSMGI